jgi:SET domain-containing protein
MSVSSQFADFPLTVHKSAIENRGVFAVAAIPAGRRVVEYRGEKIRLHEALLRVRKALFTKTHRPRRAPGHLYLARLNRHYAIDGAVGGSGAELINHSCDPNLLMRRKDGRIFLYSKRAIRKSQELTVDYRFGPCDNPIPCKCGSRKCRGTINRQNHRGHSKF